MASPTCATARAQLAAYVDALSTGNLEKARTVVRTFAIAGTGTIMKDAFTATTEDGLIYHGWTFGYPVSGGIQSMFIAWPEPVSANDPRIQAALDHVATLWRSGFTLAAEPSMRPAAATPEAPVAPPVAPAAAAPQRSPGILTWGSYQSEQALTRIAPCSR